MSGWRGGAGAGEEASQSWMSRGYEQWRLCLFFISMGIQNGENGDVQEKGMDICGPWKWSISLCLLYTPASTVSYSCERTLRGRKALPHS